MQKINLKNSRGLNLVANLYLAESKSIIIMSHGLTGDKSEAGNFNKTAEVLNKEGYNVIAFDFSGCGESDNSPLTVDNQVDDLKSVLGYANDSGFRHVGLLGYSLGALVSAKVYDKNIETMVFWAPATAPQDLKHNFSPDQIRELTKKGYFIKTRDKGIRREYFIPNQIFEERANINQKDLLSRIQCPILIVHGDKDEFEPIEDSKSAMQYLPDGSRLEIIQGADHKFYDHLDKFIRPTISWFKEYLKI